MALLRLGLACHTVIYVSSSGCGGPPPESQQELNARDYGALVLAVVGRDTTRLCADLAVPTPIRYVLTLTARQCLSCDNVGYAVRTLRQRALADTGAMVIVAPASDVFDVCQYLKRERVAVPVVPLHDSLFPPLLTLSRYLLITRSKDGQLEAVVSFRTLAGLVP